ncbi:MAG: MG2 domain-containing protein, partial [Anaerolineae bacterium]
ERLGVTLYRVAPRDWPAYATFDWRAYWRAINRTPPPSAAAAPGDTAKGVEGAPAPPGELVWSGDVRPGATANTLVTTAIDLSPALQGKVGNVVVVIEPPDWDPESDNWHSRPAARWVALTRLGVDAYADREALRAWVTNLADGTPVSGARLEMATGGPGATTNRDGLAAMARPRASYGDALVVTAGNDATVVPAWSLGLNRTPGKPVVLRFHTFDDRGLYRPGETVHVKGWVRRYDLRPRGDIAAPGAAVREIAYALGDQGREVITGTVAVGAAGGFAIGFTLPEDSTPGALPLSLVAVGTPDGGTAVDIRVAEFRRPDFEVSVTAAEPLHFIGDRLVATTRASYFAGGALAGAEVNWTVSAKASHYQPPGHDSFHFGRWAPPFLDPVYVGGFAGELALSGGGRGQPPPVGLEPVTFKAVTAEDGTHQLAIDVDGVSPLGPASVVAEAAVTDVNRQALAGRTTLLVHPAAIYLGLRAVESCVKAGADLDVEALASHQGGNLVTGREIRLTAERVETRFAAGRWREEAIPAGECALESGPEPVTCRFATTEAGLYRLTGRLRDDAGRPNETVLSVWVAGPAAVPSTRLESERVLVVPDREGYAVGDEAKILIQAPWPGADGLAILERSGVVDSIPFHMDGPTHELRVPIEDAHVPGLRVRVDLVGAAPRDADAPADSPPRPAFATGEADLPVPPVGRTLAVAVEPDRDTVEPGSETEVSVLVRGPDGAPMPGAEVALVVVDEAVLSLTDYSIPNPLDTFYRNRYGGASALRSRHWVALADLDLAAAGNDELPESAADGGRLMAMGLSAPTATAAPMA